MSEIAQVPTCERAARKIKFVTPCLELAIKQRPDNVLRSHRPRPFNRRASRAERWWAGLGSNRCILGESGGLAARSTLDGLSETRGQGSEPRGLAMLDIPTRSRALCFNQIRIEGRFFRTPQCLRRHGTDPGARSCSSASGFLDRCVVPSHAYGTVVVS
jgi:hypothetical protein